MILIARKSTHGAFKTRQRFGSSPTLTLELVTPMKRSKQAQGRMSRRKGHQFEREVAVALRVVFPRARRHLENHEDDATRGADLMYTGCYRIQCKRGRKYASLSAINEVQADPLLGEVPLLVTQGDNEIPLVAMPLAEFIYLLARNS